MIDKVNVDKDPAFADLRARNLARSRLFLQGHGVDAQERGGFVKIEGLHRRVKVVRWRW